MYPTSVVPVKVLLVDDSADDRFFFHRAISRTQVQTRVFEVEDGQEAIAFLSHQGWFADSDKFPTPHIIFLDLKMPGCDGFDVLRWIGKNASTLPVKVVVLSGSEEPQDIRYARQLGAADYLVKPVSVDQLQRHLTARQVRALLAS